MSKQETGRALLRAFADAARMIQAGFDPRSLTSVEVLSPRQAMFAPRRTKAYQKALLASLATAYGS